jgi:glutathione peroxidase
MTYPYSRAHTSSTSLSTNGAPYTCNDMTAPQTAYDFSFDALSGKEPISLKQFEGRVLLIVNTASRCGFTHQYKGLEDLYETYKDQGLTIIGVPCNDFGQQEPGTSDEIANFCQINYGVSFPMTAKYAVTGSHAHPYFAWAHQTLGFGSAPKWNFHKYLIDRHGRLVDYFYTFTSPQSRRLIKAIENELSA